MVEDTAPLSSQRFEHWMFPCSMQNACYNLIVLFQIQVCLRSSPALSKIAPDSDGGAYVTKLTT